MSIQQVTHSQQIVYIIVVGLGSEGCLEFFNGLVEIVLGQILVNFVNNSLNVAAPFASGWSLRQDKIQVFVVLAGRVVVLAN